MYRICSNLCSSEKQDEYGNDNNRNVPKPKQIQTKTFDKKDLDVLFGDTSPLLMNNFSSMKNHPSNGTISNSLGNGETNKAYNDGPSSLLTNWEIAYTQLGEKYFIDHTTGTTHWTDPRMKSSNVQIPSSSSDLPSGWERVDDPQYGVYYIDHTNKRTQYEKPSVLPNGFQEKMFTRNPQELQGELIIVTLTKTVHGLGFTLIGGDDTSDKDEFLQIKNIIINGPAHRDGRLRTGDILVYINNECVLGYKQHEIIRLFQSIPKETQVNIRICRGYPMLFDPTDIEPSETSNETEFEIVIVQLIKGHAGFGFTITESPYGQQVNTIVDKERCRKLQSGDILVEINGISVKNCSHADIVDIFRQFRISERVTIICKRYQSEQVLKPITNGLVERNLSVMTDRSHSKSILYSNDKPNGYHIGQSTTDIRQQTQSESDYVTRSRVPYATNSLNRPKVKLVNNYNHRHSNVDQILRSHYGETKRSPHNIPLQPIYNKAFDKNSNFFADYSPTKSQQNSTSFSTTPSKKAPFSTDYVTLAKQMNTSEKSYIHENYEYITTDLIRHPDGFGFRIVGGMEERSPVSIAEIVLGGAADVNGELKLGDEIVEVVGRTVIGVATHMQVVEMLSSAGRVNGHVKLVVRRKIADKSNSDLPNFTNYSSPVVYPFDITLIRRENDGGFGFVIVSSLTRKGAIIGEIIQNSPAGKCRRLKIGDCITAVNKMNISDMSHGEIVNLVKDSGFSVTLTVGQHDPTYSAPNSAFKGVIPSSEQRISVQNPSKSAQGIFAVELGRGGKGFGFSIRGGREFSNMPLFVLRIADNGSAQLDGRLQIGDQLMEINGESTVDMSHAEAIDLIKRDPTVRLLIRRSTKSELGNIINVLIEDNDGNVSSGQ